MEAPSGTVTFLFTDVEGSSHLWETEPDAMQSGLARHDRLLQDTITAAGGHVFKTTGDGVLAAFADAAAALGAASDVQRAVAGSLPFRLRIALHTGAAEERDGDYFGSTLNRTARLLAIGHGGQVLVSHAAEQLVRDRLWGGMSLKDLGEHRLRDLARPERVFQLLAPGLRSEFPPLSSLNVAATNLPVQLTSFVGRDAELAAVGELLAGHRMVTLTGTGGVGKTRLAVQLAAELLDRYRDGVWLVELASVEAQRAVEVIAGALGVDLQPGRAFEDRLAEELRRRRVLVVLDNCEHIVREVRRVAELLLREAPGASILATSREGLRVPGEQLFPVPSLDGDAALQLFVERAGAVDPAFVPGDRDRAAIVSVCDRLDGIPLAIELAAGRVPMFSVEDLAQRVRQRFRLLTGGRGTVERHQTLRAAIDWSYELLSPPERVAFARLSVFAGGCTLEAAEAVTADAGLEAGDVLDLLAGLVDKSLVVVDRSRADTRYDMMETIRQYAEEHLVGSGDADAVRGRHARWYADFARAAGRGLYSADEPRWLTRLQPEVDNLQVAVAWAVGADETDLAMRLGGSFPRQAMARPLLGTAYLAEQAMEARGAGEHPLRARVMAEAAWAAIARGDMPTAQRLLHLSIEAQRHGARYAAAAYSYMGALDDEWASPTEKYEIAKQGIDAAEAAGDVLGAIGTRVASAVHAMLTEHDDEALDQAQRALADARRLGQPTLEVAALYANGVALFNADPARANSLLRETIEVTGRLALEGDRFAALRLLAALEARHGDPRRALVALRDELGAQTSTPTLLRDTDLYIGTAVFNRLGRPDLVARCDGMSRRIHVWRPPLYMKFHHDAVNEARAALGDDTFEASAAEGASMEAERFREMLRREIEALLALTPSSSLPSTRP